MHTLASCRIVNRLDMSVCGFSHIRLVIWLLKFRIASSFGELVLRAIVSDIGENARCPG